MQVVTLTSVTILTLKFLRFMLIFKCMTITLVNVIMILKDTHLPLARSRPIRAAINRQNTNHIDPPREWVSAWYVSRSCI